MKKHNQMKSFSSVTFHAERMKHWHSFWKWDGARFSNAPSVASTQKHIMSNKYI